MRFVFLGVDRPDGAALRAELRPAHAAYQAQFGNPVGGPLRDRSGAVCGTMFVFEADGFDEAEHRVQADPFVTAGLFAEWTMREFVAVDWPGLPASEPPSPTPPPAI